ncbi:TLC domain-containing protein [Picochlorum sp. SENEW3]|nr:TLC domain-containing protein [Picochlorum sp. SENEW3]
MSLVSFVQQSPRLATLALGSVFISMDGLLLTKQAQGYIASHFNLDGENLPARRKKLAGQVSSRLVGCVFLILMFPSAISVLLDPMMRNDMLYAISDASRQCIVVASAYFIYDLYICVTRYSQNGFPFLVHGVLCCLAYAYPLLSGNMHYLGANFLMWEVSTPFLYLRWYLIKTERGDSPMMGIANALFALSFFACRVVSGPIMSLAFWRASGADLTSATSTIPQIVLYMYRSAMFILNGLNYYWFHTIINVAFSKGGKNKITDLPDYLNQNGNSVQKKDDIDPKKES